MHTLSPAWPHGTLEQFIPGLFCVMGTNRVHHAGVDLQTSRTMLVVQHGGELTLINTVRLGPDGLAALDALGKVAHVVRLGAFHGRDDPFYREHYGAALWALPGSAHVDGREPDRLLGTEALPLPRAQLFVFQSSNHPEAALLLPHAGGVLVTCDAIQNWATVDRFFSAETGALFEAQGLIREANVPSTWLGACEPSVSDFELLLAHDFRHLVSAHGAPLLQHAHERVRDSVRRAFQAR